MLQQQILNWNCKFCFRSRSHRYQIVQSSTGQLLPDTVNVFPGVINRDARPVQYLYTHIQKINKVREKVFLTEVLCDQFFPPHNITKFQKYYRLILTELKEKGAKDVLILLSPPYFQNQTLLDYQFYKQMRNIILPSKSDNNHILNLDHIFFSFKEPDHGILGMKEGQEGAKFINIDVRRESFQMMRNSRKFFAACY